MNSTANKETQNSKSTNLSQLEDRLKSLRDNLQKIKNRTKALSDKSKKYKSTH